MSRPLVALLLVAVLGAGVLGYVLGYRERVRASNALPPVGGAAGHFVFDSRDGSPDTGLTRDPRYSLGPTP